MPEAPQARSGFARRCVLGSDCVGEIGLNELGLNSVPISREGRPQGSRPTGQCFFVAPLLLRIMIFESC
jgi:hypothetical protein